MSRFPITRFTFLSVAVVAAFTAVVLTADVIGSAVDTEHQTRRVPWPENSDVVEADFDGLFIERFEIYNVGVELDPAVSPSKEITPAITFEVWNLDGAEPRKMETSERMQNAPLDLYPYCGPGIWTLSTFDASAKRVRVKARLTESTPAEWRRPSALAIRKSGAYDAARNARFSRLIAIVVVGLAAGAVLLIAFLLDLLLNAKPPPRVDS